VVRLFGLGTKPKTFEFKCPDCGNIHRGSPSFAYDKPVYVLSVPEQERDERVYLTEDLCRILPAADEPEDETIHCIRATLDIPILDAAEPFCWGVWVTQSEESFGHYVETFSEDQSEFVTFGWLPVTMPPYERSAPNEPLEHLKCDVHWGVDGQRPKLFLQESAHPLYLDQRDGISWNSAIEIARKIMHG
jgi:hypothetical protein